MEDTPPFMTSFWHSLSSSLYSSEKSPVDSGTEQQVPSHWHPTCTCLKPKFWELLFLLSLLSPPAPRWDPDTQRWCIEQRCPPPSAGLHSFSYHRSTLALCSPYKPRKTERKTDRPRDSAKRVLIIADTGCWLALLVG
jgi:hypothetical protein